MNTWNAIVAVAAGMLAAATAAGQVRLQDTGNVLDANPQLGSRGRNAPVQGIRVDSQLYVTGQVSGLGAFSGRTGYFAPDQLNLTLPTAGLDTFRRQSVSLQDVLAGGTYYATPYFSRNQTVLNSGAISRGANASGTSEPLFQRIDTRRTQQLYQAALEQYKAALPTSTINLDDSPGMPLATDALPSAAGVRTGEQAARARTARLFGVLSREDREQLARQFAQMDDQQEADRPEGLQDTRVEDRVDARVTGDVTDRAGQTLPDGAEDGGATRGGPLTGRTAANLPAANQDVYFDLLRFMGEQTQAGEGEMPKMPDGSLPPPATEDGKRPAEGQEQGVSMTDGSGIVLHSLAGKSQDVFNRHMKSAEANLSNRAYYRAAADFHYASLIDNRNPLAPLGRAVALFGAGEPLSAAFHLRRALEIFPPLMETKVALVDQIHKDELQREMARLDKRLERKGIDNEAQLLLLATFVKHNTDRGGAAREYAARLRRFSEDDPLGRAYADYILTGERPGPARDGKASAK